MSTVDSMTSDRLSPADPSPAISVDDAWTAVLDRDALADGRFVYAVSTTRIYCRPVCPARRPRPEHVSFFRNSASAKAAGYRPCRRCRPDGDGTSSATACVERARVYLEQHLHETVTLKRLARVAYMSPFHLQRSFKRVLGVSPREYVRARRTERLKARLRAGDTVSRATFEAGYSSGSRLYEHSDSELGMTPATYRRGGEGERIRYAVARCWLGRLLVGVTERGVCTVAIGDSTVELEAGLRAEFPRATLHHADDLGEWMEAVLRLVNDSHGDVDLPLDVRATAFQQRVWNALRAIPFGETRSYGEIADAIGSPRAARAVARACADNRIALAIPCHRVVRGDGEPGGYRWGPDRKRRLLERERQIPVDGIPAVVGSVT